MKNIDFTEDKSLIQSSDVLESEDTISFQTEIPKQIQQAMKVYIEKHLIGINKGFCKLLLQVC